MLETSNKQILLVGNPNVGKSTIFNVLCNKNQKTGNYAGVTVSSHSGKYIYKDSEFEIIDLPGSYSIYPSSEDEAVFYKYLVEESEHYQGVIYVIEALSIKRGLLLFQQIQDLGKPIILVINQIDQAKKRGIDIDVNQLSKELKVNIVTTNAKTKEGIEDLRESIYQNKFKTNEEISFSIPIEQKELIHKILSNTKETNHYKIWMLLASETYLEKLSGVSEQFKNNDEIKSLVPKRLQTQETIRRYQNIDKIISKVILKKQQFKELLTEKLDKILVHPVLGYIFFALILISIFQAVFFLAQYPMDWIDSLFTYLADYSKKLLPEGPINSLLSSGIIPGIGGIVIFAPQIGILLYLLYLLEDSGYMARVIFLMDRFLRPFGLNGKSIVPLVSGTACAIPAIMSTRNIENIKERLITILVTPFMTCSARLPVYSIIISLVIPDANFLGFSYKALMLFTMYLIGFVTALAASFILKSIIKAKEKTFLIMDLPAYKKPLFLYDFKLMLHKVWDFITGAGKTILIVSIIIWVLSYFGSKPQQTGIATDVHLDQSYLAKIGKVIEPTIAPLGYDWKIGVGILSSFAAREAFVGTISTIYSLDDDSPENKIIDKMHKEVRPNGEKVYSLATGLSILMYYAFAMQCISTIAVVYKETKSWKWTAIQAIAMSTFAYLVSFLVYQFFK